jgi:poly(beta-D-mannuronate) C5 epimerase
VAGLRFARDTFRDNDLYGLDPHSYSHDLVVEHVVAKDIAAHGIIFSQYVTHSVVENSVSRHNGENGIMMNLGSGGNVIRDNRVYGNRGDGIVTEQSPRVTISGNLV